MQAKMKADMLDMNTLSAEGASRALGRLSHVCNRLAGRAGWWKEYKQVKELDISDTLKEILLKHIESSKIALIHSEISETLEGLRKDLPDDKLPHRSMEEVELADTLIRIFDYSGEKNLDLGGALIEKLMYNINRADHQPDNRDAKGGKKI